MSYDEARLKDYITTTQAAELTGLEKSSIRRKAAAGGIPGALRMPHGQYDMWLIPRAWAKAYKRPKVGRPKKQQQTQ